MTRKNPRGNPNIGEQAFVTDRKEPLNSPPVTLRLTQSLYKRLMEVENHKEFVRAAIEEKLKREGHL